MRNKAGMEHQKTTKLLYKIVVIAVTSQFQITAWAQANSNDEIITTAKRSEQSAVSYAGSISKIDQEQLTSIAAIHPAEALNTVAGVNIHRGSGQEHLTAIRSPVLTGGAGAGSFLYLEDGVPLRAAGFSNVNGLFESAIELAGNVEIAKGPGSVLYGSNALHGLINILSAAPLSQTGGYVDTRVSSEGFAGVKASLSGPFASGAARIGVSLAHDNGFREASGFDQQKLQIRYDGVLAGWDVRALSSWQNLNQETAGFIRGDDAYLDEDIALSNPNPEAYRDGEAARLSIRLDRKINDTGSLTLIPYARWTRLDFLRHFVPGQAQETNGHKSAGLLASYIGQYKSGEFVLGVDGEITDGYLTEFQDGPNAFSFVQGAHYDYQVKSKVFSAYGQTDYRITPNLSLDLGVRLDVTDYDYHTDLAPGSYGRFLVVPDRSDNFTIATPKAALNYKFSETGRAYVRVARGARAPQTSDAYSLQAQQIVGKIETETLDALEAGISGKIAGFSVQVDAYVMKKDNFFFRDSSGFNVTDGKTKHAGFEFGIDGDLTEKLHLNGNVSWAKHQYDFDLPNGVAANAIKSGDDVDSAPRTLATVGMVYDLTPALNMGLEWRHVGKYFTDPGNTQSYPGHDIFVLRGEWNVSDRVKIYSRLDNLFDAAYADRADFAFGAERYFPGRPRTVFIGIKAGY
jgi:outer membrane receptor protein involved in Fe transport